MADNKFKDMTEQEIISTLRDTLKEYVTVFTNTVTKSCKPLGARYSMYTRDFYMDYSCIYKCYTKAQAKQALEIFNKYSNIIALYAEVLKLRYPQVHYEIGKTAVSSSRIGKDISVYNLPFDLPTEYFDETDV